MSGVTVTTTGNGYVEWTFALGGCPEFGVIYKMGSGLNVVLSVCPEFGVIVLMALMSFGSAFHRVGPATPKALLRITSDLVKGTLSRSWLADRRLRPWW